MKNIPLKKKKMIRKLNTPYQIDKNNKEKVIQTIACVFRAIECMVCRCVSDHLRFGIICGPIWGSFAVWESFAVGDLLRRCTDHYGIKFSCYAYKALCDSIPFPQCMKTVGQKLQ